MVGGKERVTLCRKSEKGFLPFGCFLDLVVPVVIGAQSFLQTSDALDGFATGREGVCARLNPDLVFFAFQKCFVKGAAIGSGVKG